MPSNVLLLQLSLKYELENAQRDIERVVSTLNTRWHRKAKHMKNSVTFVIVTGETDTSLMEHLKPRLDRIVGIENYWIFQAPRYALCRDGSIDPFSSAILDARKMIGERRYSQHMRDMKRSRGSSFRPIQNSDRRTIR